MKARALVILAHPDDEILFGWPLLQEHSQYDVYACVLSHNRGKYGEGAMHAFRTVCDILNITNVTEWVRQVDTNFSRLDPRPKSGSSLMDVMNHFLSDVQWIVREVKPDVVFTHNPMGEYGHTDHRMVFHLASSLSLPMLLTDICFTNPCHFNTESVPPIYRLFYKSHSNKRECDLNMAWFEAMKAIYVGNKSWSWSRDFPRSCSVYLFS